MRVTALLPLLLLVGCAKKEAPSAGVDKPSIEPLDGVEVSIGGKPSDRPRLGFRISKSYEKQKLDGAGHSDGGDWTFCDAETEGGARFTFGIRVRGAADAPFSFGDAWIMAADRAAGAKLTEEFARAFHVSAPPPGAQLPLAPMQFPLAILSRNSGHGPGGGYAGRGSWTATKLFPAAAGKDGEVYLNFSAARKLGEFAEKDSDYDKTVAEIWARGLRDGEPPAPKEPAAK